MICPQAATSSKDEWHGKELGTRGGKAVHMLIHHRYISIEIIKLYSSSSLKKEILLSQ
jgi:hypothetical protein